MAESPSPSARVTIRTRPCFKTCTFLAGDRAAAARAFIEASPDASADALAALEERRAALQAERLQVKKELRNEARKRRRLLAKAKGLSEEELVSVMIMKAQAKAKASAKAKSEASSR